MWEKDVVIQCPACGSIFVEETEDTGLWECPYCRGFSVKDWDSAVLSIIGIIFGILILANTLVTALLLPYIIGAFAIVGVLQQSPGSSCSGSKNNFLSL